jgi:hypothetical protein
LLFGYAWDFESYYYWDSYDYYDVDNPSSYIELNRVIVGFAFLNTYAFSSAFQD